ncbi:MAG TPA: ABC transporter substrate-binding protein [Candidatus Limnocylindria bacterium]|nr:ABC transporter substrate-binding protein [Candidatus Limnocylindria bacterium]
MNSMIGKIFFWLLASVVLATASSAQAQQAKKVTRIGYLVSSEPATESTRAEGIRLALRELGYIEGRNIAIEYRYAEGKNDRHPKLAAELVRLKVDVIVVAGGVGTIRTLMNATKTIPIVMTGGADPVEAGLIESLARPGGNVTGLTILNRELGGKRLELLKEAVPKLAHVAVLYDPTGQAGVLQVKEVLPVAARALKLTLRSWEVRDADGFDKVFAALSKQRPDGLYVPASGALMRANQKRIVAFALKSRLPSIYYYRESVDAGGLMSYGADLADSYRRVATYVDKILKGAKPADLPVEQPTKFELVINLKTAKQIGLTIPPNVLARADRVSR